MASFIRLLICSDLLLVQGLVRSGLPGPDTDLISGEQCTNQSRLSHDHTLNGCHNKGQKFGFCAVPILESTDISEGCCCHLKINLKSSYVPPTWRYGRARQEHCRQGIRSSVKFVVTHAESHWNVHSKKEWRKLDTFLTVHLGRLALNQHIWFTEISSSNNT